jgi:hypothetical protein
MLALDTLDILHVLEYGKIMERRIVSLVESARETRR